MRAFILKLILILLFLVTVASWLFATGTIFCLVADQFLQNSYDAVLFGVIAWLTVTSLFFNAVSDFLAGIKAC